MILALALAMMLGQQPDSATTRELERIEEQLAATWTAGDCAGWGALLAPDWSVTHITGEVLTKAKALDMCKAPRPSSIDQKYDELSFRVYGDAAVVTGRNTVTVSGATPTTLTLRFTDVFIRTAGRWHAVASHATRLTP